MPEVTLQQISQMMRQEFAAQTAHVAELMDQKLAAQTAHVAELMDQKLAAQTAHVTELLAAQTAQVAEMVDEKLAAQDARNDDKLHQALESTVLLADARIDAKLEGYASRIINQVRAVIENKEGKQISVLFETTGQHEEQLKNHDGRIRKLEEKAV